MKYKYLILFSALALIIFLVSTFAFTFLHYQDQPSKVDVVVLFVGKDLDARIGKANSLASAGYAEYLLVPLSNEIHPAYNGVTINAFRSSSFGKYPRHYESTHVEVLEAKRIMDLYGLKKAIFISIPIQMRRLKIMTDQVFPKGYQIRFIPAQNEAASANLGGEIRQIGKMVSEYIKITWYLAYRLVS
ncbi:MAG: hypothetical protein ABFD50_10725 [Smithella sp.]